MIRGGMWTGMAVLVLAILVLAFSGSSLAQEPSMDEINEIASQLSCPTCTGISLADCPTETCAQWRAEIGRLLAEGKGQQEILDYFAARYGYHVLQTPPARGVFLWVWLAPVAAIIGGIAWWGLGLRWRHAGAVEHGTLVQAEAAFERDYVSRVEAELERWEQE